MALFLFGPEVKRPVDRDGGSRALRWGRHFIRLVSALRSFAALFGLGHLFAKSGKPKLEIASERQRTELPK
jgi:hypothetical protein